MKRQDETELPEDSDLADTEYFEVSYIFHNIRSSTQLVCRSYFLLTFSHYDSVFTLYGTLPPSKFFPNLSACILSLVYSVCIWLTQNCICLRVHVALYIVVRANILNDK